MNKNLIIALFFVFTLAAMAMEDELSIAETPRETTSLLRSSERTRTFITDTSLYTLHVASSFTLFYLLNENSNYKSPAKIINEIVSLTACLWFIKGVGMEEHVTPFGKRSLILKTLAAIDIGVTISFALAGLYSDSPALCIIHGFFKAAVLVSLFGNYIRSHYAPRDCEFLSEKE